MSPMTGLFPTNMPQPTMIGTNTPGINLPRPPGNRRSARIMPPRCWQSLHCQHQGTGVQLTPKLDGQSPRFFGMESSVRSLSPAHLSHDHHCPSPQPQKAKKRCSRRKLMFPEREQRNASDQHRQQRKELQASSASHLSKACGAQVAKQSPAQPL